MKAILPYLQVAVDGEWSPDSWVESSSEVFPGAGKEYIKAGKFDKAIEELGEALGSASEAETPEIHYYLAYASTSAFAEAVFFLLGNNLSQDAQRAPLYYFLLGLGHRGAEETEKAKQALSKVLSISRESELGKAGGELMQSR